MKGFRFDDLRHTPITELAEAGAPDATLKANAGHLTPRVLEHYSHVRMQAKREAPDKLSSGLMGRSDEETGAPSRTESTRVEAVTSQSASQAARLSGPCCLLLIDSNGGRSRARTGDLLLVRQAL